MTRIVDNDDNEIFGYVLEIKSHPIPYLRVRRMETIDVPINTLAGFKKPKIGFGTDIVFMDDIKIIESGIDA